MTRFDQIEHACLTDTGIRRDHNQDSYAIQLADDERGWQTRGHLFLVADGMGAHAAGEEASERAALIIPDVYQKHAGLGPPQALRRSFVEANAAIHACGQQNREFEGMGTTSTALLLRPDGAWVGHVGDSRCYRVRNGVIEQLSYDHSLLWEYARLQHLDPDEVEDIPTNVIHRCLGPEPLVQVDVEGPHALLAGDVYLLCSDGLSGQVTDAELGAVVSVLPPAEACRFLVDLSNLRGGPDNITVLIARVGGSPCEGVAAPQPGGFPWWLLGLVLVPALAGEATWRSIEHPGNRTALLLFLAALASLAWGLLGLLRHRQRQWVEHRPAQPYRSRPCPIERSLLDKLVRALRTLRQRAQENHWDTDWNLFHNRHALADELLSGGDQGGAFREYCRAMLVLTQSLPRK